MESGRVLLTISVEVEGAKRELNLLARRFSDLLPVMGAFSAYMREDVQRVFDTEGAGQWPARKEATAEAYKRSIAGRIERVERNKYRGLSSRLQAEKRRAIKTASKPAKSEKKTERRQRAIERKESQIAEVARLAAGGELKPQGQAGLYKRVERRIVQSQTKIQAIKEGKTLGRIAQSCTVEFDRKNWSMRSVIPWAGVHNEGGRVGHGATVPKRTFLEWTNARLDKFEQLAADYLIGKAGKAASRA